MNPQDPTSFEHDPKAHVDNTLSVMQPGERIVCDIRRHPVGVISTYVTTGVLLIVIAIIVFGVVPAVTNDNTTATAIGAVALLFLLIIFGIYGYIFTKVYWANSWMVTSDSITQITQKSLMKRRSSQIGLDILEDVTAEQNGILARFLNYGTLHLETAGDNDKYNFDYCPNPNYYVREILAAREAVKAPLSRQETPPPVPPPAVPISELPQPQAYQPPPDQY